VPIFALRLYYTKCQNSLSGNGYITTLVLKDILREIDSTLSEDNLEQIVEEIDEDESGTVDFNEFMAMMTGE
jgi:Ca2+-binding EF-hand superfamily protein